jgi:hypothetical protein
LRCAWRKGKQDGVFRQLRLLGPRLRGCWPRRSLRLRYVRPAGVQKSTCSEGDACRECSFRDVLTGAGQDCGCHEISCGLAGPWQSRLAVGWLHVEPLHTSVGIFLHFKHPCPNYFLLSNGVGRPCPEVRRCDSQKHPHHSLHDPRQARTVRIFRAAHLRYHSASTGLGAWLGAGTSVTARIYAHSPPGCAEGGIGEFGGV